MKVKVNIQGHTVWMGRRSYDIGSDKLIDAGFEEVRYKVAVADVGMNDFEYAEIIPYNPHSKNKLLFETKNGSANGFGYSGQEMLFALERMIDLYSSQTPGDSDLHHEVLELGQKPLGLPDCVGMVYDVPMKPRTCLPTEIAGFMTTFETTRLSPIMVENINSYSFAMVNAKFMLDTMRDSGVIIPVYYVPLGVRSDIFTYFDRPIKDEFTFGHFGALNTLVRRKGTEIVVHAFERAFPQRQYPKVKLHIKSSMPRDGKDFWDLYPFDDRIRTEHGQTRRHSLVGAMHEWDCLVMPTRGEGFGLCVHPDTELYTLNRSVKISEVKVGEKVLTEEGTFQNIHAITKRREGELYEVKARDNTVLVTKEHPFFASKNVRGSKVKNMEWLNVTTLKKGNFIAVPIPKLDTPLPTEVDITTIVEGICYDDNYVWYKFGYSGNIDAYSYKNIGSITGETKKVVEKAVTCIKKGKIPSSLRIEKVFNQLKAVNYKIAAPNKVKRFIKVDEDFLSILGWYLAKGSYSGGNMELSLGVKDTPHTVRIKKWLTEQGYLFRIHKVGQKLRLVTSNGILGNICEYFCGKGAHSKRLNDVLMQSASHCSALLNAYALGDGYITDRTIIISTVSQQLAYQIKLLTLSLGYYMAVTRQKRTKGNNDIYRLVVNGKDAVGLGKAIGIEVPNTKRRLGSSVIRKDNHLLIPIKSIQKVKHNGYVYDIGVDAVHSFVGNGLLLHNTIIESMASGLPVITTGWSAMPDYIKDMETGLFCDYKLVPADWYGLDRGLLGEGAEPDVDSVAERMKWVYEHRNEAKRIGLNASREVAKNWTWQRSAKAIIKAKNDYLKKHYHEQKK